METARLAPRVDISLPTDTVFENNVLLILSNEGKALYVFHTETREQMIAIMDRFQTKTQLMIAKIDKTFDTASQSRFFFLDVG